MKSASKMSHKRHAEFQCPEPSATTDMTKTRRKRLRRDTSSPNVQMAVELMEEKQPEVPFNITEQVINAVTQMNTAKPVGGPEHLQAVRSLRQLLSLSDIEPPYRDALHAGAIHALISALQPPTMTGTAIQTILEASWALTNLAVGDAEVVKAVVEAAPLLIAYVGGDTGGLDIAEQCAWALGNIGGEDMEYRDILVANGVIGPLARLVNKGIKEAVQSSTVTMSESDISSAIDSSAAAAPAAASTVTPTVSAATTAAWALTNFLHHSPSAIEEYTKIPESLENLVQGMHAAPDIFAEELAWITAGISSSEAHVTRLATLGMLRPLAQRIAHAVDMYVSGAGHDPYRALLVPLLRSFGNIIAVASIPEHQLPSKEGEELPEWLRSAYKGVVICAESEHYGLEREAAWVLSNVAGIPPGDKSLKLLDELRAVPVLKHLLKKSPFFVKKEAAHALANIAAGGGGRSGDAERMNALFGGDLDAVRAMVSLLRAVDMDAVMLGLQFVEMLLRVLPSGKKEIEFVDGIDALEALQFGGSASVEVQSAAAALVDKYWGI